MRPPVAVIIPCFNAEAFLAQAIRSALNQTVPPAEVIVVDNGSIDGSRGIAASFGPPVRLLEEERMGAAAARGAGVAAAGCDAMMFLDADDLMAPDTLDALGARLAEAPDEIAICPWMRFVEVNGVWLAAPPSCAPRRKGQDNLSAWLTGWYHPPCSVLWSRAAYERSGGWDPAIPVNNDGDVMMRGLVRGNRLLPTARGTGYYRRLPGDAVSLSGTRATRRGIESRLAVIDRIAAMLAAEGRLRAYAAPLTEAYEGIAATCGEDDRDLAERCAASAGAVTAGEAPAGVTPVPAMTASAKPTSSGGPVRASVGRQAADMPAASEGRPRISVIIPSYNRARQLPRAIGSALGQDVAGIEVIVVDDGSTDGTDDLMSAWRDPRLRYLSQSRNTGVAAARNRGLREARGDFIAFLDSDDEWLPGKLAAQLARFEAGPSRLGLVYGHAENVDRHGRSLTRGDAEGPIFGPMLATNLLHGGGSSAMIRREVVETVGGFDESLPAIEDWDYWVRIARFYEIGAIDRTVVRIHDDQPAGGVARRSRRFAANMAARETFFRRYEPEMLRARVAHLFLHDCARRHLEHPEGDRRAARHLALKALARAPGAARCWAWVLYSSLSEPTRTEVRDASRRIRTGLSARVRPR